MRVDDAASQQKGLINISLALIAGDPVAEHCFVFDDARREMRHHIKAFAADPLGGRDHVFDWRAFNMGDVDARALRQNCAEIFDFLGSAGHHLNRKAVDKRRNGAGRGGGRRFLAVKEA